MSVITTHVLDIAHGRPASGLSVVLEVFDGIEWQPAGAGRTGTDGRCGTLLPEGAPFEAGTYRLIFDAGAYFASHDVESFYAQIPVVFEARDAGVHYHVPLLLSPFGYSTYRGT